MSAHILAINICKIYFEQIKIWNSEDAPTETEKKLQNTKNRVLKDSLPPSLPEQLF